MSPSLAQALMLRKSDQALCAAVRDGHEAAFAAIVLRYRSQLLRHCRSLLRNGHAEDAVQQTFVRALQALRSGTEVRELGPWLHRIARNVALTELSGRDRDHTELSEEWEDRGRAGEIERRAELREALLAMEALPDRQRTALVRSVSGEAPSAIAAQLGLSNVAVRQLLHRARVTVRAAVNALAPPPLIWFARRVMTACDRLPRAAGVPAGAAPVASKIAVVVVASATVAAPATVIHAVLTHHHHHAHRTRQLAVARPAADAPPPSAPSAVLAPVIPAPRPVLVRVVAPPPVHAHRSKVRRARANRAPDPAPSRQQTAASAPSAPSAPSATPGSVSAQAPAASSPAFASASGPSGASGSASGSAGPVASASASGPTGGPSGPSGP